MFRRHFNCLICLNFGVKLPEDGVHDAETCGGDIRLYFSVTNVHLLLLLINELHIYLQNCWKYSEYTVNRSFCSGVLWASSGTMRI